MTDLQLAQHVAHLAAVDADFAPLYAQWCCIETQARQVHQARHALRTQLLADLAEADTAGCDAESMSARRYIVAALTAVLS